MLNERQQLEAYWALKQLNIDPATLAIDVVLVRGIDMNNAFLPVAEPIEFKVPQSSGAGLLNVPVAALLASLEAPPEMTLKDLIMTLIDRAYRGV